VSSVVRSLSPLFSYFFFELDRVSSFLMLRAAGANGGPACEVGERVCSDEGLDEDDSRCGARDHRYVFMILFIRSLIFHYGSQFVEFSLICR
jgi:hypothetical protein